MNVSLKLVELQIALPRMYDVGKIQDELQQQSQLVQAHLTQETQKQDERMRRQVTQKRSSANVRREKESETMHPYKGNNIDVKG
ncbi:hypothetical protein [Thermaerobacillus caldiproteolyticus]|uniref:hypothetical protein n=1 Tax=Thermaerobacillus caldiproteolyticus TaxID=247480 RepID=UPI001C66D90A|nr:hypothetical protein [Anoxybacillus caldiproteolyticus]